MHFGLVIARPGDRTFAVVDDDARRHPAEGLEGTPVTSQPGRYRLVSDELDILVARPREGHDEEPRLMNLAGEGIGHQRPRAEIDLRCLGWLEIQTQRHVWGARRVNMKEETIDRRVAAGVAVIANECGVDCCALDASCPPFSDLRAPRLQS